MKDCALVVVDMLYDFIDGSMACQEADKAVAGTLRLIDKETAKTDPDNTGIRSIFPILFVLQGRKPGPGAVQRIRREECRRTDPR